MHDGFLEEVNAWWFSKILKGENKGNWETGQGMQGQGSRLGRGKVYKQIYISKEISLDKCKCLIQMSKR